MTLLKSDISMSASTGEQYESFNVIQSDTCGSHGE